MFIPALLLAVAIVLYDRAMDAHENGKMLDAISSSIATTGLVIVSVMEMIRLAD